MTRRDLKPRENLFDAFDGLIPEEEALLLDAFAISPALSPLLAPPPRLKRRLMEAVEHPRYAFLDRVASLLRIATTAAREVLDALDSFEVPELWMSGGPGVWIQHISIGPRDAEAVHGLVRVAAGAHFPLHSHVGTERVLVLQGSLRDSEGHVALPGDMIIMPPDSHHTFQALLGDELRYVVVIEAGVDFRPAGGPLLLPRGRA